MMPMSPQTQGGYAGQDTDMVIEEIVKLWPDPYIIGLLNR